MMRPDKIWFVCYEATIFRESFIATVDYSQFHRNDLHMQVERALLALDSGNFYDLLDILN